MAGIVTRLAVVALCIVAWPSRAVGDGCHFPEPAFKDIAHIPAQRALISFRNGTETLIIESALSSDSPNNAWVIPLPSKPTSIERVAPGALKTLSFRLQPGIFHDISEWAVVPTVVLIVFLALAAASLSDKRPFSAGRVLGHTLVVLLGLLVLAGMLLPALGTAGAPLASSASSNSVEVHSTVKVGAYEVTVLTAADASALDGWLRANGFATLPPEARTIVADYIRDKWCFCVAKLTRDAAGESLPHPLKVVFAAKDPVYPMRLTALARSTPLFEIFVVHNKQVASPQLETEYVDVEWQYIGEPLKDSYRYFDGEEFGNSIAHNELLPLLWHGCVLTKLSGPIPAERMTKDLYFETRSPRPYRHIYFSKQASRHATVGVFSTGLFLATLVTMIVYQKRLRERRGLWRYARSVFPVLACSMIVVSASFYALCPTVEVLTGSRRHFAHDYAKDIVLNAVIMIHRTDPSANVEQFIRKLDENLCQEDNVVLGGKMAREESPGNYSVRIENGQAVISVYDMTGSERICFTFDAKDIQDIQGHP